MNLKIKECSISNCATTTIVIDLHFENFLPPSPQAITTSLVRSEKLGGEIN